MVGINIKKEIQYNQNNIIYNKQKNECQPHLSQNGTTMKMITTYLQQGATKQHSKPCQENSY